MGQSVYIHDVRLVEPRDPHAVYEELCWNPPPSDDRNFTDPGGYNIGDSSSVQVVPLPPGLDADRLANTLLNHARKSQERFQRSLDAKTSASERQRLMMEPTPWKDQAVRDFFRAHAGKWRPAVCVLASPTRLIFFGIAGG